MTDAGAVRRRPVPPGLGGVLGLRFADVQVADRRLVVVQGKGGLHRVVPVANRFFDALGAYLHVERPGAARTDRVFVVLKGPRRGLPLSAEGWMRSWPAPRCGPADPALDKITRMPTRRV